MDFLAAHQFTVIGLIFMLVLGPAVGNYACSVVYRLPLGKTPFERHPYCGHCNTDLKPRDLFPIISWLSTRGKCRYCRGPIPGIYTLIELACLGLFIAYFLAFSISETFLLLTAYGVFVIMLAAIEWQQGWLSSSIYSYAFAFAAIHRTLLEGSIYGWVKSFLILLVLGAFIVRAEAALLRKPYKPFEANWLWWMALIAVAVPVTPHALLLFLCMGLPLGFAATRLEVPLFAALALLLPLYLMW